MHSNTSTTTIVPCKLEVAHHFLKHLGIPATKSTAGKLVLIEPEEATRLICEKFSTVLQGNCPCVRSSIKHALRILVSDWPVNPKTGKLASQNSVKMDDKSPGHPYANFIHSVLEMWAAEFVTDRNKKKCHMGNNCHNNKKGTRKR